MNCALVTSVLSIQNGFTFTLWTGDSSGRASGSVLPIMKVPPGIHTIPGGVSSPRAGSKRNVLIDTTATNAKCHRCMEIILLPSRFARNALLFGGQLINASFRGFDLRKKRAG